MQLTIDTCILIREFYYFICILLLGMCVYYSDGCHLNAKNWSFKTEIHKPMCEG